MSTTNTLLDYCIYTAGFTFVSVSMLNRLLLKAFFKPSIVKQPDLLAK
jgi:hypothetical protein